MGVTPNGDSFNYLRGGIAATAEVVDTRPKGYIGSLSFTAVAAAIGAGDVMGAIGTITWADSAGNTFTGGELLIRSTVFEVDETALQASEAAYALKLYSVTPPSALADNAPWDLPAGDRASYLASLAITAPTDIGSTLLTETDSINKQITVPATGLTFAYLVTVAGFTPTATVRKVRLHAERI